MAKVLTREEYKELKPSLEGKKVVLCHGVFDLLHPGHIEHFKEAKSIGDILVVSVTAQKYVRKGTDRPYFNDKCRLLFLSAITYIDYVILDEEYSGEEIIELVEPTFYVKGQEYKDASSDITGKIYDEVMLVRKHGGDVYFTTGDVYSSTKLINTHFSSLSDSVKSYMKMFKEHSSINQIREYGEEIAKKKILVLGDSFFDHYHYSTISPRVNENGRKIYKVDHSEIYCSGALYVASVVADFTDQLTVVSVLGEGDEYTEKALQELEGKAEFKCIYSSQCKNIVRHEYIEKAGSQRLHDLNSVYNCNGYQNLEEDKRKEFLEQVREMISSYDIVMICDYGYGLLDQELINLVQEKASFLAVNARDMGLSQNMNSVLKYDRSDTYVVEAKQLEMLEAVECYGEEEAAVKLEERLSGKGFIISESGDVKLLEGKQLVHSVELDTDYLDYSGTVDAFFTVASLFQEVCKDPKVSAVMGNIARALEGRIAGHSKKIEKVNVIRYASTLLNI